MLLPHESTVKHDGRPVTEEPRRGVRLADINMGSSIEGVHRGRISLICAVVYQEQQFKYYLFIFLAIYVYI